MKNKIFKTDILPFIELRYISKIISCDRKHQHNELTLTVIKKGKLIIEFNHKENNVLRPLEISIINPHEVHAGKLSNIESFGCYVLYLDKEWCRDIQDSLFPSIKGFLPLNISLLEDRKFYNEFMTLCNELLSNTISFLEKEEKLITFFSDLFLEFCSIEKMEYIDIKSAKLVFQIKEYLEDNIERDILLEEIADYMQLSVVHLLRVFKKEFGLPIHAYLLNKRVHLAKKLLLTKMPISEIAQESGFFDQSHLNKSFKRVFQLTPKEYQKSLFLSKC